MSNSGTFQIRPAGRHILTIGRDLVQNFSAAIIELVKNSYDADSPSVEINFQGNPDKKEYTITIVDQGHGMTRDTVINEWMVPSTKGKLKRRESPSGRIMQGSKGIGRYAASILGNDLSLETVTNKGEKTTIYIEWKSFEEAAYLDDVPVLIETSTVKESSGTKLTITGDKPFWEAWDRKQIDKIQDELKKLKSPIPLVTDQKDSAENFRIRLDIRKMPEVEYFNEPIEPYPMYDLFDYRIAGDVQENGKASLTYSQQNIRRNILKETIDIDVDETDCGTLFFDIRVYDRDPEAIQNLIDRGLKNSDGYSLSKVEAKKLLDTYNGIGVYRNGFRIRPLGDSDFDWLELDTRRVQNPSMRIGNNQVIGYVQIQSERLSNLKEKSSRDGLTENKAYSQLKEITQKIISQLETRRFEYRNKTKSSRPASKIEHDFQQLLSFDRLKESVQSTLAKGEVRQQTSDKIIDYITREEEAKNKQFEGIRQAVAIYQGQATLGKIINVILHEGRKPLSYFKNEIPYLKKYGLSFEKSKDFLIFQNEIMPAIDGLILNADMFVKLFSKLDPLAATRRSSQKLVFLRNEIQKAFDIFKGEMELADITYKIDASDEFQYRCWPQDIYAIFTNLLDNSIHWIKEKKSPEREINIQFSMEENSMLHLDYHDTGPGIEESHIKKELIFEPGFSTKPTGTGLGLAIAGEASARNGLELKAMASDKGAHFVLQSKAD